MVEMPQKRRIVSEEHGGYPWSRKEGETYEEMMSEGRGPFEGEGELDPQEAERRIGRFVSSA